MTERDKLILAEVKKKYKCRNNSEILLVLEELCDKMRKKVSRAVLKDAEDFGKKKGLPLTWVDDDFIDLQIQKHE